MWLVLLAIGSLLLPFVESCVICRQQQLNSAFPSFSGSILRPSFVNDDFCQNEVTGKRNGKSENIVIIGKEIENILFTDDIDDLSGTENQPGSNVDNEQDNVLSSSMVASIGFYKNFISPLLPPACRFVPTCSQYGVQAIQEFGPMKGFILTGWRILRCSPFGGKGYDPPKWPPCSYWGTGEIR